MSNQQHIRLAQPNDYEAIEALIQHSMGMLGLAFYTSEQLGEAIGSIFGLDRQLVVDQTYYVVEDGNQLLACGGWSWRDTLFGSDQRRERNNERLNPNTDPARIRAFFVHPDATRRGIASQLLSHCEQAALKLGFHQLTLMATLSGVTFYERSGYCSEEPIDYQLESGMLIQLVPMTKTDKAQ